MKRTPLSRKTPLRRRKRLVAKRRPNPSGSDPAHLAYIRTLPCAVCGSTRGVVPHHSTVGRGLGQKTSDHEVMPLCAHHHSDFHNDCGPFINWTRRMRRVWQRTMVDIYRPKAALPPGAPVEPTTEGER